MELSYFKLRLIAFLKESHPDKVNDNLFIQERSELATDTYAGAITSAYNHLEALEQANAELYWGLHFSKYNTLFEVLAEEFTDTVAEAHIPNYAIELLPLCEDVFSKYSLSDDFADTPEYEQLYTELTGKIIAYGL
jgi:uncharacterized protein DUF1896